MTALELCQRALANVQSVVDEVRPDDLEKLTTCTDWHVRTLINHMIGVLDALEAPARGDPMNFNAQDEPDFIGSGGAAVAFSRKASEFMAAWNAPGATERRITTMFGEQPADFYLGIAMADMLLHGWDLATAIGATYAMDEDAASHVLSNMQRMLKPEMRGEGKAFATEVPVDPSATVQERLLAFSGREARTS
jgi:uncharacterized protein (TIGR03086 family)